jgi:hypothetical protein
LGNHPVQCAPLIAPYGLLTSSQQLRHEVVINIPTINQHGMVSRSLNCEAAFSVKGESAFILGGYSEFQTVHLPYSCPMLDGFKQPLTDTVTGKALADADFDGQDMTQLLQWANLRL